MAAALLARYAHGRVVVRCAGTAPAGMISPAVTEVMAEAGLDLPEELPGPPTAGAARADVVIAMGCGDARPAFPGERYLDWDVDDPVGQDAAAVQRIRDNIDARVRALLADLLPGDREAATAHPATER